jgi:phytoene dehydrogenase-like protein
VTTMYFAAEQPLWSGRKICLNANPDAFISHAAMLTNVAPTYAPPGQHLLSASVLGVPDFADGELFDAARADLARMLAGDVRALDVLRGYRPLAAYRIPYAQFAQPPGFSLRLPKARTGRPDVFLAGEFLESSSIDGALASGEACAAAVLGR